MDIKFQGTMAVINDTHNPFQDQRALREVELFLEELQPGLFIKAGDAGDFYPLSKFDKNPNRKDTLQDDCDSVKRMNTRQRSILPNTRIIDEEGNHCDRLRRFLWTEGRKLSSLRDLSLDRLYGLSENDIEHIPYEEGVLINGKFMVTHSDIIRAHSAYTAKGMSDKHGGSGIHGHTHRLGSYYKRNRFGTYGWWENGCLCSLNPDWIQNPNWQQGFSLVHFIKDRFWVEQIPIFNRKFMYGGKIYGSGGKKRK